MVERREASPRGDPSQDLRPQVSRQLMNYELTSNVVVVNPLGRRDAPFAKIFPFESQSRGKLHLQKQLQRQFLVEGIFGPSVARRLWCDSMTIHIRLWELFRL